MDLRFYGLAGEIRNKKSRDTFPVRGPRHAKAAFLTCLQCKSLIELHTILSGQDNTAGVCSWYPIRMSTSVNPIPPGFQSLSLHLNVEGAAAYIDFLKKAFGAVELSRSPGSGGKLRHALLKIGESMLMLSDDFSKEFGMPPVVRGNLPFHINLYVPDADATAAQAVAAGCQVTMPVSDQFWGDRYGLVRDPFGFAWAIATHKEDLTPAEIQARAAKAFGAGHP